MVKYSSVGTAAIFDELEPHTRHWLASRGPAPHSQGCRCRALSGFCTLAGTGAIDCCMLVLGETSTLLGPGQRGSAGPGYTLYYYRKINIPEGSCLAPAAAGKNRAGPRSEQRAAASGYIYNSCKRLFRLSNLLRISPALCLAAAWPRRNSKL